MYVFLKLRDLLPNEQTCTKIKHELICGGKLKEILKNSRKDSEENILKSLYYYYLLTKKECQTFHLI